MHCTAHTQQDKLELTVIKSFRISVFVSSFFSSRILWVSKNHWRFWQLNINEKIDPQRIGWNVCVWCDSIWIKRWMAEHTHMLMLLLLFFIMVIWMEYCVKLGWFPITKIDIRCLEFSLWTKRWNAKIKWIFMTVEQCLVICWRNPFNYHQISWWVFWCCQPI